jgi:homoaconitate hydratase
MNDERISSLFTEGLRADEDAYYAKTITLDLSTVTPHVAGPDNVKTKTSITDIDNQDIRIHKAYLVSCVNSRVSDLAEAAKVLKGKKVADGVEFYIAAASMEVQEESIERGDWQILKDAGAIEIPPGCGPCIGLGVGLLEDGEVGISATNRNFKGRMGSREAKAYLASPAVVAASAIAGKITGPEEYSDIELKTSIMENQKEDSGEVSVKLLKDFPEQVSGEMIFCPQNNLNTDGIYPGKYTYIDDFTPEQQAEVVMENYDPDFVKIVNKGDILIGGYSFGSGSSREQAATALKYRGVQLVIAGSFSQTYKRNAINNGYVVLEAPKLVNYLKEKFKSEVESGKLTIKTGIQVVVDFKKSQLIINGKVYGIDPVGVAAQELVIEEGLENWVKNRL